MKKTSLSLIAFAFLTTAGYGQVVNGEIEVNNTPVSKSTITLWKTSPKDGASIVKTMTSNKMGKFSFSYDSTSKNSYYYLTSKGGVVNDFNVSKLSYLSVLPQSNDLKEVTLNELSTIGSVWPNAQLINSRVISGSKNGLKIGNAQVPNLVDISTGTFGQTILNGQNSTESEAIARMNTLASIMTLCTKSTTSASCNTFLKETKSTNTLDALVNIAKKPWINADNIFKIFTDNFKMENGKGRREGAFLPYLSYVPDDFSLKISFSGGGIYSAGRMMFDKNGNLWSGQNWMPGSQSSLYQGVGGGVVELNSAGKPLSPALVGFNSQSLDGIGWGTTVSENKVWVGGFNAKIGVFDLNGNPLGPKEGITLDEKIGGLQGLGTAPNGDVWVTDNQKDQLIKFPNGDETKGEIIHVKGLKGPFAVQIDNNNVVWVSNANSNTVTRFPANNPSAATQINVGISPRGIAIDAQGYVWVASNLTPGYPLPKIPKDSTSLEEFDISVRNLLKNDKQYGATGMITLINPQGKVVKTNIANKQMYVGWGVSSDGDNNIFASSFLGKAFFQICGTSENTCPKGYKTGDVIHKYQSGLIQLVTDTMVDDAGNVWVANNWNKFMNLISKDPKRDESTKGGGSNIVVIYGIAHPVKNPLIGQVRAYD